MKTRLFSQLILLVGVGVGITAVWAGSAPFVGRHAPVLGGYPMFYDSYVDGVYVATTLRGYLPCTGTTTRSCSAYDISNAPDGPHYCWGGDVTVAVSSTEMTGLTIYPDGLAPCDGTHWWCWDLYEAKCEAY